MNLLAGACMGIAILCKWLPALIIVPIWLLLIFSNGNFKFKEILSNLLLFILTAVAVSLPWQIYAYLNFPLEYVWEQSYNTKHLFESVENHSGSIFYFMNKLRINYGELIYLPLIWFVRLTFLNSKDLKNWAICIWIFIPLIFFSIVSTKMPGYIAFTAPALFLVNAAFLDYLLNLKIQGKGAKLVRGLLAACLIILPVRYSIERIKPFAETVRSPYEIIKLKELGKKHQTGILFNYPDPVTAMFYTNLTVYPFMPDSLTEKDLLDKGHVILFHNPDYN